MFIALSNFEHMLSIRDIIYLHSSVLFKCPVSDSLMGEVPACQWTLQFFDRIAQ